MTQASNQADTRPPLRVLGIRHHGPGSARAVVRALEAQDPQIVLIEGPPEADALVTWASRGLVPPVALLAYDQINPHRASYWPFAEFSPEWQALVWAAEHRREVRFCDLPAAVSLAQIAVADDPSGDPAENADQEPAEDETGDNDAEAEVPAAQAAGTRLRKDPIAVLASVAGYDDPERWWDDAVEGRHSGDPFDAITEAMAELRAAELHQDDAEAKATEAKREAAMRQALRKATKEATRVAVVCGAWHAPALVGKLPSASADAALLRSLEKVKISTAWVPWTHSRLSFASGYGAGVDSPGWYHHLFTSSDAIIERWMTAVAGVLRGHDLPVSSAHAIEATRLAEALATMRDRPMAGLAEVQEAALAVMCEGNGATLRWVTSDLVVGERLGEVPAEAPMVPLEADLRRLAKSARLAISVAPKELVLDLRKPTDRAKSALLQRLAILGISWGTTTAVNGTGTFKEGWTLCWQPEFSVSIVLASRYGTTVRAAAEAAIVEDLGGLAQITARVEAALAAELETVVPALLRVLDERAAHEADIAHLLDALPALVRAQRYGTVRGTDISDLGLVAQALLARACAGLPAAVSGLSEDAAAALRQHLDAVQLVMGLLPADSRRLWLDTLGQLVGLGEVPGTIAGRVTRILFDADELDAETAATRLGQALSHGPNVAERAAFAEGYLAGGALLLVHDEKLMPIIDEWVGQLSAEDFLETLPVLRRAFGAYTKAERRQISERIGREAAAPATSDDELDWESGADILATVQLLLRGPK